MATTLTSETPLAETRSEILHTRIALESYPYFPAELTAFQAFEQGFDALFKQSLVLGDTTLQCTFNAKRCDGHLNVITNEVAYRISDIADSKQRDMVRKTLFGHKKPSAFRKPILGGQLKAMSGWPLPLSALSVDSLKSYAPAVQSAVEKGQAAEHALADAIAAESHFYAFGAYRAFLDSLNASRNELEGKAAAYRHAHPELNLPKDFEKLFFKARDRYEEPTSDELFEEAAALETKAAKMKARAEALKAEELAEEKARLEAEEGAKLAELSAAEAEAAALAAKIAAMKAGLAKA